MRAGLTFLAATCALLLTAPLVHAHDVMGTVVYVDLGRSHVHLEVELPVDELRLALAQPSQPAVAELPAPREQLAAYLLAHLKLATPGGAAFTLRAHAGDVTLHDARNWLHIDVDATPPAGASPRDFILETDVIDHRVVSHHVFVFLRHDLETGQLGPPSTSTRSTTRPTRRTCGARREV